MIHYLAALGQSELIKFVSNLGADLNLKARGSNYSPLVIAAARGHDETVRVLLDRKADLLYQSRPKSCHLSQGQENGLHRFRAGSMTPISMNSRRRGTKMAEEDDKCKSEYRFPTKRSRRHDIRELEDAEDLVFEDNSFDSSFVDLAVVHNVSKPKNQVSEINELC